MTMERVTVAELKARLSHYLREVREGRSFTVVSHGVPVATLSPHDPGVAADLQTVAPDPAAPRLSEPVLGRPASLRIDAVDLIRADRDDRLEELDELMRLFHGQPESG